MISIGDKLYKVEIERKRIRNIYLRVDNDTLRITCPKWVSNEEINKFIYSKAKWIIKSSLSKEYKNNTSKLVINDSIYYLGKKYPLTILQGKGRVIINEDNIIVYSKDGSLEEAIKVFYKNSKKKLLELIELKQHKYLNIIREYGYYDIPEYKFRVLKSAWGINYTKKNLIMINERLIHFNSECLEAILWHELLHFIIPNHSKRFHEVIEYHMPRYKEIIKSIY